MLSGFNTEIQGQGYNRAIMIENTSIFIEWMFKMNRNVASYPFYMDLCGPSSSPEKVKAGIRHKHSF